MAAYYNEFDPFAAQWLRNLIAAGLIAPGDVDERSIEDVPPDDLEGYDQCHFFAGIGGWSLALRLAGWPDDRPVWTGSCPCQPFSAAGKRAGTDDPRHLWPVWHGNLIAERRPPVVFGEQVASKDGRAWLAGIRADLEALGYGVGAADLCAAGAGEEAEGRIGYEDNSFKWQRIVLGAPHIRQRLWFAAERLGNPCGERAGRDAGTASGAEAQGCREWFTDGDEGGNGAVASGATGRVDDPATSRRPRDGISRATEAPRDKAWLLESTGSSPFGGMGDTDEPGPQGRGGVQERADQRTSGPAGLGFWSTYELIPCTDGKARRVEPGTSPLAHGIPNRVGRLRGYGNAICPEIASEFIMAYDGK